MVKALAVDIQKVLANEPAAGEETRRLGHLSGWLGLQISIFRIGVNNLLCGKMLLYGDERKGREIHFFRCFISAGDGHHGHPDCKYRFHCIHICCKDRWIPLHLRYRLKGKNYHFVSY